MSGSGGAAPARPLHWAAARWFGFKGGAAAPCQTPRYSTDFLPGFWPQAIRLRDVHEALSRASAIRYPTPRSVKM